MPSDRTVHRIYQGRITAVELLPEAGGRGRRRQAAGAAAQPLTDWQDRLLEAHALFQTAVNWYLLALAALVDDHHLVLGGMRQQLRECWDDYHRGGTRRRGLRYSIAPLLGRRPDELGFDDALAIILDGNTAAPAVRATAIDLLLHEVEGGDNAIQQQGREYLPRLCWTRYTGGWACDATAVSNEEGERRIASFAHADPEPDEDAIRRMASEFSMGWLVALQPNGWMEETEARERVRQALEYALRPGDPESRLAQAVAADPALRATLEELRQRLPTLPIAPRSISRNRRAHRDRTCAAILFKVAPSRATLALLRLVVARPRQRRQAGEAAPTNDLSRFACHGDDPVKLARGTRGFVFPAFTALPMWGGNDLGEPSWKEFDIAAFKEALKTINQIRLKTAERQAELKQVEARLCWMRGEADEAATRAALRGSGGEEAADDELPPVLAGDPRVALLERVLRETLAISNELTDGESLAYGLRARTLRGWRELCARWNAELDRRPDANPERLIALCDQYQAEHRDDAGAVAFFRALAERDCWPIWRTPSEAERDERARRRWSDDLVHDYARYLEWQEEAERLRQPIRCTPADPEHSPRLLMLSDFASGDAVVHVAPGAAALATLPVRDGDRWVKRRVKLHYSAPRLRRDQLVAEDGACLWLPPVAAALDLPQPTAQDFNKTALALMPRRRLDGRWVHLVNLPVQLDIAALQQQRRSCLDGHQFVGTAKQHLYLHWPGTGGDRADWWHRQSRIRALAVDLGQRSAAACALIEASPDLPPEAPWVLGSAEGPDGRSRTWRACLIDRRLVALPGEGQPGRNATPAETDEARQLLQRLAFTDRDDPDLSRLAERSFPEQNDLLLVAARRRQGHLARLHRWLWMLGEEGRRSRALEELKEAVQDGEGAGDPDLVAAWQKARDGDVEPVRRWLRQRLHDLQRELPELLLAITQRIVPLRRGRWVWVPHPDTAGSERPSHLLARQPDQARRGVRIRGQRGVSLARIEQLEELRRRWMSLNRALQRQAGERPPSARQLRDQPVPEPCPELLAKIERIKEDRVDQLAHAILVQALGVRLKARHDLPLDRRRAGDHHGEYERFRDPVDMVVLEDLSRYLSDQGRAPQENTRLMQWAHRQVLAKVKMLCEPYGIPVAEVPAAYSSRFCSRTGIAGFRAVEVTDADRHRWPWRRLLAEAKARGAEANEEARQARELFALFDEVPPERRRRLTLLAPRAGGPLFVPIVPWPNDRSGVQQADLNAAINIGLRALAGPTAFGIRTRLRVEPHDGQGMALVQDNRLERARGSARLPDLGDERTRTAWYIDHARIVPDRWGDIPVAAEVEIAGQRLRVVTGKALWTTVKREAWRRAMAINGQRVAQAGAPF